MKAILAILLASLLGAAASGCLVHAHGRHGGVAVVVPAIHVHDAYCGHYYHGDRWYFHHGHRHGSGCGHVYISGRWIIR
jgi:hypothetical protein